jgi:ABC-type lipoprotein export system ATPase subunit
MASIGLIVSVRENGGEPVTHDPRYTEWSDRQIFMFDGKIVGQDSVQGNLAEIGTVDAPSSTSWAQRGW